MYGKTRKIFKGLAAISAQISRPASNVSFDTRFFRLEKIDKASL